MVRVTRASALTSALLLGSIAPVANAQPIRIPEGYVSPAGWAELAAAVSPAVVSIHCVAIETAATPASVDPFEFFFRDESPDAAATPEEKEERVRNGGSGFLVSADGLVVTNFHVIEGAVQINVKIGSRLVPATVRGIDEATDLALLQIKVDGSLPYLELGDSDAARVGDALMAMGNPLSLGMTVTTGIVSGKNRAPGIADAVFENFIQTDAAITFGNSGGPMVDVRGRVVAVSTAIHGSASIGFAVPSNTLREILPQLRDQGFVIRGYMGVEIRTITELQALAFGVAEGGALVSVDPKGTPAAAAGVRHGDVIVGIDQRKITSSRDFIDYVSATKPGSVVTLRIIRNRQLVEARVTLKERRRGRGANTLTPPSAGEVAPTERLAWLGIEASDIADISRTRYGIPKDRRGALITAITPISSLNDQSVRAGCVITEVNGRGVNNVLELDDALSALPSGSYVRFYMYPPDPRGRKMARPFFAVAKLP